MDSEFIGKMKELLAVKGWDTKIGAQLADTIGRDNRIPVDAILIVRQRNPADLGETTVATFFTEGTDYVTQLGMMQVAHAGLNYRRGHRRA
jgi:hypothetical protein